jgi:hypothetical protein
MSKLNIMITDKQITDKETELCYYYVRFRVIRPEYVFTPLMYLQNGSESPLIAF